MKEFIVRLFSLLAIVGVLFGYNEVLDVRAKDEEIAKLNAQLEVQSSGAGSDSGLKAISSAFLHPSIIAFEEQVALDTVSISSGIPLVIIWETTPFRI